MIKQFFIKWYYNWKKQIFKKNLPIVIKVLNSLGFFIISYYYLLLNFKIDNQKMIIYFLCDSGIIW